MSSEILSPNAAVTEETKESPCDARIQRKLADPDAINVTPNRTRVEDGGQNIIMTPPRDHEPREYDSPYIFEDSMTEDLDISPVTNKTFNLDSDDEDDEGFPKSSDYPLNNNIDDTSFTISKPASSAIATTESNPEPGQQYRDVISYGYSNSSSDDDCDEDESELININMNADRDNVINLSIIYEENSFDLEFGDNNED